MTAIYSGNTKVLKELTGITHFGEAASDIKLNRVMIIDTETTGLDKQKDEIVEVAFHLIEFDSSGNFYKVLYSYSEKQEPSFELSEVAQKVTGYTKEHLKGSKIDWDIVNKILNVTDVVLAFNSVFDRPFLERYSEEFKNKFWVCAMTEIDYLNLYGFTGSQELLIHKICSMFYGSHNALNDVNALSLLMSQTPPNSSNTLFYHLLKKASQKTYRVLAVNADFSDKDTLRDNGYKFNYDIKTWFKDTTNKEEEIEFLNSLDVNPEIYEINGFNKFK